LRNPAPVVSLLSPLLAAALATWIGGCGTAPRHSDGAKERSDAERPGPVARAPAARAPAPRTSRGGGYYLDDGPGDAPPPDLDSIPEPVPQMEPLHRGAMRPYVVLGQSFTPMTELQPYKARGIATWYGRRYHGKQTSTGEVYDMYAVSAAHPTLPLPSYARVTNVATGKSVIVRVNDRGPFIDNRLIDLSYTAAHRLGVIGGGSALVEVEAIIPNGAPAVALATVSPRPASTAAPAAGASAQVPRNPPATPAPPVDGQDPILAIVAAARDAEASASGARELPPVMISREAPPDYSGVYLQLAAFGSRENAESYLARARVQFEWLAERLQVRAREGLYRVHAGPYGTAAEAKQAAERIALGLGVRPVVTR
jgi:rare lipoprotein A